MKACKLVEKALAILAYIVGIVSVVLSYAIDERLGYSGVLTLSLAITPAFGAALIVVALTLGVCFSLFGKNGNASVFGYASFGIGEALLLAVGIAGVSTTSKPGYSTIIALVSAILFIVVLLIKLVRNLISAIKFGSNDLSEPTSSAKVKRDLLGWKELLDEGFLTEEEYEAKRKTLVSKDVKADK